MSEKGPTKRAEIRWPDLDTVYTINPDGSRNFLHPADVRGRYQRRKNLIFVLLILVYAALPWIPVGGHPAIQIDIPGRRAFLFGNVFGNQDFYLMFFLVTGMGFALFVVTTLWGRIWCGYACPQTVFLEGVYRRVERWIEGPRTQRIRRNLGPWTADKIRRKGIKHAIFLVLSLGIAHIFLAYFIPVSELRHLVISGPQGHETAFFWSMFWTGALYVDYAWFREQTCLIICPYGRLQSALIDSDTVVVGYDRGRGEPRSKVSDDGGDCVDCHRCVAVCPTGIDIRNGLQMECVGCANCVDACDEVMAKIGRPSGLIRYDSRRGLEGEGKRPLFRPRVILYAVLGLIGISVFLIAASAREPYDLKVLRARGLPYTLEGDHIRDLYTLRIENKEPVPRVLTVRAEVSPRASAPETSFLVSVPRVELAGLSEVEVPVFVTVPRAAYSGHFPLRFTVTDSAGGTTRDAEALFRGP